MNGNFKRKKQLTSIIIIIYMFLTGCEYGNVRIDNGSKQGTFAGIVIVIYSVPAIIFPSAWAYLQSMGVAEEYWLGFTISGLEFSH